MLLRFVWVIPFVILAACSVREVDGMSLGNVPGTTQQTVFIATQRNTEQIGALFGQERSDTLRFAEATVSIPPDHESGQIEWTSKTPDPAYEFAITGLESAENARAFSRRVQAQQDDLPGETLVFIHGFNTTAVEAIFRLAQIQEDLRLRDPGVLFTWPSAALPTGYIYDRDSVLFARDDLVEVLSALTQDNNRVIIAGHSMGAHLTMEVLRQARLMGNDRLLNRISAVILMSPDIDIDVFHRQAEAIGTLPQPFVVLAAEQDRALNISSVLTGRPRLGSTVNSSDINRIDVTLLDFSKFAVGDQFDHLVPVTSPGAIELMRALIDSGLSNDTDFEDFLNAPSPNMTAG